MSDSRAKATERSAVEIPMTAAVVAASDDPYRTLFRTMSQGVVFQDANGIILDANPAAERILGLFLDQMTGRTSMDPRWRSIHEDGSDFPGQDHPSMVALRTGQPVSDVVMGVFHPLKNQYHWLLVNAVPLFHPGESRPYQVYATFADITDKKRIEKGLRESAAEVDRITRERYTAITERNRAQEDRDRLFNLSLDMMCIAGFDGYFKQVNHTWFEVLGWSKQELLSKPWLDFVHPDDRESTIEAGRQLLVGEPVRFFENRYLCKDGSYRWMCWNSFPLVEEQQILAVIRDITERKKSEGALLESERRFRNLFHASLMGIHLYRLEGSRLVLIDSNEAASRMTGTDNTQLHGKTIEEAFPPLAGTEIPMRYREAAEKGIPWETMQLAYEDEQIKGAYNVYAFQTRPGEMAVMFLEVTRQKQYEERLRRNEATLSSIFKATPVGVGLVADRVFRKVNDRLCEIVGYSAEELIGRKSRMIYPSDEEFERVGREKYDLIRAHGTGSMETRWRRKDGRIVDILLSSTPLDINDWSQGVTFTALDITERKKAAQDLERLNADLKQKNAEMEQFIYTVSHDLKSPLFTIQGFAGHIQQDLQAGRADRLATFVERIVTSITRMKELTEDLLDLSRIGRIVHEPEPVAMTDLMREIEEMMIDRIRDRQVQLVVQENMPVLMADRVRLRQVFENLLGNALIHGCTVDPPRVEVGFAEVENELRFFVHDNGRGIPVEYHHKVFEVFQRLDMGTPGTGVGLAIVRRIVENNGGRVWVESRENAGTTFWVSWPSSMKATAS